MNVITITGYKPNELGIFQMNDKRIHFVKEAIKRRLIPFLEDGVQWILISGQAGVECWAGEVVLQLREDYNVKLAVIPPFLKQEQRWKEDQQQLYQYVMSEADFVKPLMEKEYQGPHQFRLKNRWLIDKSDACIMLYEEEKEGSPKFFLSEVRKVKGTRDYPLYYITSFDLDDVVREMELEGRIPE
ncbi:SLOG family protein [Salirhabdus salicampi]|uniref:SLOG family protein n=1 Tax=Salirhabdus salicampi TaxID=476102 RepID=UPI0020C5A3DE|nr:DUF1273 domain-containing protein [Salirhabdus salicampi]MCP8616658.1 DUF1273 domain-containing protein [Salirhabdus salicampi]